jgi:hypothetical protein
MNVDDLVPIRRHDSRRQNPHVPRQHHQIGLIFLQRFQQPVKMRIRLVGRLPAKFQPRLAGNRLQIRMIRQNGHQFAMQLAMFCIIDELLKAVRFLADQQRHLFLPPLRVQVHPHLHVDPPAQVDQPGDDLRQIAIQVLQIDQHVHHEKTAHHALLDVLDIDPPIGHVRGELRNHALLVLAKHTDNREHGLGHRSP